VHLLSGPFGATVLRVHGRSVTEWITESQRTVVGCAAQRLRSKVVRLSDQDSPYASPASEVGARAEVKLHLPSRPDSPMTARHSLSELERSLAPETMAKLRLLVTELVANSVRHARGTPINVTVTVSGDLLRTEVSDGGEGFDPPRADPNPLKPSGWGLFLVRRMADRWGAEPSTGTVWFEIERVPPP
jgi:anti-sigma regulatory factor (Ser/Thr protein kinase)